MLWYVYVIEAVHLAQTLFVRLKPIHPSLLAIKFWPSVGREEQRLSHRHHIDDQSATANNLHHFPAAPY